jgi:hypothetical protein
MRFAAFLVMAALRRALPFALRPAIRRVLAFLGFARALPDFGRGTPGLARSRRRLSSVGRLARRLFLAFRFRDIAALHQPKVMEKLIPLFPTD